MRMTKIAVCQQLCDTGVLILVKVSLSPNVLLCRNN